MQTKKKVYSLCFDFSFAIISKLVTLCCHTVLIAELVSWHGAWLVECVV